MEPEETTRWRCTKKEALQAALQCQGKGGALENQVIGCRSKLAAGRRRSHEPAESQLAEPGEPDEALATAGSGERA